MKSKPNLLVVYNYNRYDFLKYFHACQHDFNFYFAEFVSAQEENNKIYQELGQPVYWGDYRDVFQLLEVIKPSKVLFHYIESYFHVLLNAACIIKGIPACIIDHGLRDININIRLKDYLVPQAHKLPIKKYLAVTFTIIARLKARLYLNNSIKQLPQPYKSILEAYLSGESLQPSSPLKIPSHFITISSKNYEYYKQHHLLPGGHQNYYIGIPTFDKLAKVEPGKVSRKEILFIDQGLALIGVFGWSSEAYKDFMKAFIQICKNEGIKLYVKPHPRQISQNDKIYDTDTSAVSIVNDKDLEKIISQVGIVVGFTSTYLLPFIAKSHTTVLTLENHPAGRLDVSKSLIDGGVVYPVYRIEDFNWALENLEQLHQQQLPNKAKFTEEWMYKFDGKSGERLRDVLLNDDL